MRKLTGRYVLALLAVATLGLLAGCSQYSRHPDKDVLGELSRKSEMKDSLANMDKMMGMDMAARRRHMTEEQEKAVAIGRDLFSDARLGSNGNSCTSCHPGGKTIGGETEVPKKMGHGPYKIPIPSLIGAAARFPKYKVPSDRVITLAMMDNNCMRMFMKGKRLPLDSPESYYLAMYVMSLSNGDEIAVGNK